MAATTPVVLISGGVGLTALVSMLKAVLRNTEREVVFVHGTENSAVHAMRQRLSAVAETNRRFANIVFYENPLPADDQGYDFNFTGRVDLQKISDQAIRPGADYYLCGPVPFVQAQVKSLKALGVAVERIHYEVFGSDGGEV
jgi:nitric oxide dioxygenase